MARSVDVALVSVPQWSPFQPPLSLPSLAAWLIREGHTCSLHDENIEFYDFLLSHEASTLVVEAAKHLSADGPELSAAVDGVSSWEDFRRDVDCLLSWRGTTFGQLKNARRDVLHETYRAVNSLDTYLRFVSQLSPDFSISPYEFRPKRNALNKAGIEAFVMNAPIVLKRFVDHAIDRVVATNPRYIGLSCIGQEQLLFTLMFGREIKSRCNIPVIVGGTVFSRIFERGALDARWLKEFIDVVVRNEGERPLQAIVVLDRWDADELSRIDGIICLRGDIVVASKPAPPLAPNEIPQPVFDNLLEKRYISASVTLPLLSSRGCYWGKCEFCHHGMVYGEKYASYSVSDVVTHITDLSLKYNVCFFSFNDEAIPPKVFRRLGRDLSTVRDVYFTGLMKFEPYFSPEDFSNAYAVGFRSLYVGLESASERVLALMRKNTARTVMSANLRDATAAGIWMHCFLFFGFPGESDEEAGETIDFIVEEAENIGSFGAGTFSLEHNAPIMKKLDKFGIKTVGSHSGDMDVYYKYVAHDGTSEDDAVRNLARFNERAFAVPKYRSTNWIPREHLLILLSLYSSEELITECDVIMDRQDVALFPSFGHELSIITSGRDDTVRIINRLNRTVVDVRGPSAQLLRMLQGNSEYSGDFYEDLPWLADSLRTTNVIRVAMHETSKVI